MRTRTERIEARRDVMAGVNDADVTLCQAAMEICATIDDASKRIVAASDELRKAIDQLSDDLGKHLKHSAFAR